MHSQPHLSIRLLGPFTLVRDGQSCELAYEKGRAIFAYLAMQPGQPHTRAALAAFFWPDMERPAALTNLRQVLHNLRQVINSDQLAGSALQVNRDTVVLHAGPSLQVDAPKFAAATPPCTDKPPPGICGICLGDMTELAGLYRGEFLQGLALDDCPEFETWLLTQREALLQRALVRLTELSDCYERAGQYVKSLPFAQRHLELDPWNEHGLRRLMRLLALDGQRDAALARHAQWCGVVKEELGLVPSAETNALVEHVRQSEAFRVNRRISDHYQKAPLPLPSAQRRQVTVLHCAWGAVEHDDPDEALAQLRGPQLRCSEIVAAHGGYVVQTRGGRLLAYFGYPSAQENAARQAVQAALVLVRAEFAGVELQVGVHTGMVISGGEPGIPDAVGATSEMAVRLREWAAHGEVAISLATQRLVVGYFHCVSLGLQKLPRSRQPVEVFRVERESGAQDRLQAAGKLAPLIGREQELASLTAAWEQTCGGTPRNVLLQGHPGIGKSRVARVFQESLRRKSVVVTKVRCLPEHGQSPFHPLVAMFQSALKFTAADSVDVRLQKLRELVQARYPGDDPELLALLARLMSLPLLSQLLALPHQTPTDKPVPTTPFQRDKTMQIVLERFYALARPQPFLLIVEDLHWADPSSLELLNLIVTQRRPGVIMVLFTARAGFRPPWSESFYASVTLDALSDDEAHQLIQSVAPGFEPTLARAIVERADGVPLFVEELAKDASCHERWEIPASLNDLLASRLDSMGAAKWVAQLAATIGREFSLDMLRKIASLDAQVLSQALRQLREAGLLVTGAHADYQFAHALIRDAAYQSQTRPEREAIHQRIAAELQASGAAVRPELIAQQWSAGGDLRQAALAWLSAGQLASRHSANEEAISHFKAGLLMIGKLPASPEVMRIELDLQIGLGAAHCLIQGYSSPEGALAYARAVDLCSQHDGGQDMFVAAWGLWATASLRVGFEESLELAQRLLRMAEQSGSAIQWQQAHGSVGVTLFRRGEFLPAYGHFQRVSQLYERAHHETQVAAFREDVGVTNGAYTSWVLLVLGFPDQAMAASEQNIRYARKLGHPFSLAFALASFMGLCGHARHPQGCLAVAQEALNLINQHGFTRWKMGALVAQGWALAQQSDPQGVVTIQHCVDATRSAKRGVENIVLAPLADAYVSLGQFKEALRVIEEGFATGSAHGDRHVDAELLRLQGAAYLAMDPKLQKKAEKCFQQALTVSRQQHARWFELRAATSLARLWQQQGKSERASKLLTPVYDWFTEGLATADLQTARQLLEALNGR